MLLVSVSSTDNTLQLWDATLDADLRHVHLLSLPLQKPFKVSVKHITVHPAYCTVCDGAGCLSTLDRPLLQGYTGCLVNQ